MLGVEKVELDELLSRADAITLHTPLTDRTRNILSAEALAKTRKGVIIVNAARGGLVDEVALRAALETGHVAAAGFDVFCSEPAKENALFGAPNLVATPHLGASTNEAQENVALQLAQQMSDYLLVGAVTNALNTASISVEEAPRLKPFISLVEKLGSFAGQVADDGIDAVEIEYEGDVSRLNTQPLTATALAALMRWLMPDINMVSAPVVLKQKGTPLTESKRDSSPVFRLADPCEGDDGRQMANGGWHGDRRHAEDHRSEGHVLRGGVSSAHAVPQQSRQAGFRRCIGHATGRARDQHRHVPHGA